MIKCKREKIPEKLPTEEIENNHSLPYFIYLGSSLSNDATDEIIGDAHFRSRGGRECAIQVANTVCCCQRSPHCQTEKMFTSHNIQVKVSTVQQRIPRPALLDDFTPERGARQ
ncbi:hypothetical protein AVEN_248170-1 [Araneus ventricosus]|uniref:Uncharacterized protein n=1 Tax=Araneus ventricosus TaxID=182803 RepID=A0A4Y2VVU0_ARAVE|nr:hypothetical protein AVEN_248170-1 [Araneus ventricosus]